MTALIVLLALQGAVPQAEPTGVDAAQAAPAPATARERHIGVHLGLNGTAAVDAELGSLFYAEFATQLTGLGNLVAPRSGLVLSGFLMGGVTFPLVKGEHFRLNLDAGPHVTLLHSYPVNIGAVGVAAGLRLLYDSGLAFGLKVPVAGYAGSIDQPRGSLLYYYVAAVPTMPVLTVGYRF